MFPVNADQCVFESIKACLDGEHISTDKDKSYEVLHYQTGMANPRARIMMHDKRRLNIVTAVARFNWMISGSDRLGDIAFYEPKVRGFSDNGMSIPGSDYGQRLFQPVPGVDQIAGVIARLHNKPASRQAAAVVWNPLDAVRESADIPCTFGMFFHVRNGKLHMAVNMRSNNAFRILPFNLFEFSLLQECVATELDVSLGNYIHWAASMHVYDNEFEFPATQAIAKTGPTKSLAMPPMPSEGLMQAREMARLESVLRHSGTVKEFNEVVDHSRYSLQEYWRELFLVLVQWNAYKRGIKIKLEPKYLTRMANQVIAKADQV